MTGFRDKFAQKVAIKIIATCAILMVSPIQAAYGSGLALRPKPVSHVISDLGRNDFSFDKITSEFGQIEIFWTAPGDDADSGRADHYVIKYSTSEINESNWDAAITVANPPAPLDAGTEQSHIIDNLAIDELYYVAIKSYDEAGNVSPISNVINKHSSGIEVPLPLSTEVDSVNGLAILLADAVNSHLSIYYEFALDTVSTFTAPIIQAAMIADSTVTTVYAGLISETSYFWRCRAVASDHSDSSDWSGALSFSLSFVDNQAPQIALVAPNGRERWNASSQHSIVWSDSDNVGIEAFKIDYSVNGGNEWVQLCDWTESGSETYNWNLPDQPSRQGRVRVSCRDRSGNVSSDISDHNFTIRDIIGPRVSLVFPNGGDSLETGLDTLITWDATDNIAIDSFMIEYSLTGGSDWNQITNWVAGNPGAFDWDIPSLPLGSCLIRVTCMDPDSNITSDTSDSFIFIEDTIEPIVAITSPVDGDTIAADTLTFAWNSDDNGLIVGYGLGYSIDNGQNWQTICYGSGDTCHYLWQIPQMGTNMAVRVLCADMAENIGEDTVNIYVEPNTGIDDIVIIPGDYYLAQAYPNPFNPSTTIGYGIPEASHVKLDIYDILGNLVATLVDEYQPAGFYQQAWRADNLSSGTYIYRIETGQFRKVGKAMLLK